MEQLLEYATVYYKKSTWKDMALLKFCLFSIGILCGLFVAPKNKKQYFIVSLLIFIATYIPLMFKFCKVIQEENQKL